MMKSPMRTNATTTNLEVFIMSKNVAISYKNGGIVLRMLADTKLSHDLQVLLTSFVTDKFGAYQSAAMRAVMEDIDTNSPFITNYTFDPMLKYYAYYGESKAVKAEPRKMSRRLAAMKWVSEHRVFLKDGRAVLHGKNLTYFVSTDGTICSVKSDSVRGCKTSSAKMRTITGNTVKHGVYSEISLNWLGVPELRGVSIKSHLFVLTMLYPDFYTLYASDKTLSVNHKFVEHKSYAGVSEIVPSDYTLHDTSCIEIVTAADNRKHGRFARSILLCDSGNWAEISCYDIDRLAAIFSAISVLNPKLLKTEIGRVGVVSEYNAVKDGSAIDREAFLMRVLCMQ